MCSTFPTGVPIASCLICLHHMGVLFLVAFLLIKYLVEAVDLVLLATICVKVHKLPSNK